MKIFTLHPKATPKAIILLPENVCNQSAASWLLSKIIQPARLSVKDLAFGGVVVPPSGKMRKADIVSELKDVHEYCEVNGIELLMIGMADLWKQISGGKKFTQNYGRVFDGSVVKVAKGDDIDFTNFKISPLLNPVILNSYPNKLKEVEKGLSVIYPVIEGTYSDNVDTTMTINKIITTEKEAIQVLKKLWEEGMLASDIETTGLNWFRDQLLTISLSPNKDESYCFAVHPKYTADADKILEWVGKFISKWDGTLIGHNYIGFDVPFMLHAFRGKDFSKPIEKQMKKLKLVDTIIMAYLLKNSTERGSLGLKDLVFKYMGEYDADIDQSNLYSAPLEKVGEYNNLDCRATWLIYEELLPQVKENGFDSAMNEFNAIAYDLAIMKMHGLRIDKTKVKSFAEFLDKQEEEDRLEMLRNDYTQRAMIAIAKINMAKYNKIRVNKKTDYTEFISDFNPASSAQKRILFFDIMGLPVVNKSKKTKEPSTDADTISSWLEDEIIDEEKKELIKLISDYQFASKIRNTYLQPMMDKVVEVAPNDWRIFTNFNQTKTITGRLSSSGDINLQTIPSSSKYAKKVKELFIAPDGFIIATADFNALEDRLIANESKDKNKLNIFLKNIDGHSLNAYSYFRDEFYARGLSYDPTDPASINKIKDEAPDLRQKGKSYTFGFSYGAGPKKYGEALYEAYWETYSGIRSFNEKLVNEAKKNGYIISKFSGLRLLCPALNSPDEFIRSKEERVVCNFAIQSGNFLMLRAIHKMQDWIINKNLEKDVQLILTVHDSVYLYVRDDIDLIERVNKVLIKFMSERYEEEQILLTTAELDIGHNMAKFETLPNNATKEEIKETVAKLN